MSHLQPEPEGQHDPAVPADADADAAESEDIERAVAWLQTQWKEDKGIHRCPVCGEGTWHVAGPVALPAYRRAFGTAVLVAFTVTCTTCGNMLLVNATRPKNLLVEDDGEARVDDEEQAQ